MQSSPPSAEAVPTGANLFRTPGCDLEQRKRARENEQHRHRKASLQKDTAGTKSSAMHEKSTPAGCPQRDALPLSTSGSRMQGQLLEGERTEEGAGRQSLHLPESAVSIPQDGNRNGSTLPCERPLLFSPDFVPRTQKGPLAGALVSFSLIRPEPDTVIGTTRRFQPWRELPSWLRAGGSVR